MRRQQILGQRDSKKKWWLGATKIVRGGCVLDSSEHPNGSVDVDVQESLLKRQSNILRASRWYFWFILLFSFSFPR